MDAARTDDDGKGHWDQRPGLDSPGAGEGGKFKDAGEDCVVVRIPKLTAHMDDRPIATELDRRHKVAPGTGKLPRIPMSKAQVWKRPLGESLSTHHR